jgi:hypothetical protein
MSNYQTNNPVPSIDPRDLDDNATVLDLLVNGPAASYPDRTGVDRKSWNQMEADAAALVSPNVAALAAVTPAIDKGVFFSAVTPVTMGSYTLTSFVRSLGVSANQAAFRTAIGAIALTDTGAYAGSAAKLTTARTISATGDATWSASFDGSANATAALTLAASGVGAGTYGSVTVNAKGIVTAAATITPTANGGTGISSLGTGVATFLGTPSSANLLAAVTDETGTGALVFATAPTLVTPNIGEARATVLQRSAPTTKATSFTLAATESWIVCAGAGTITVTLPTAGVAAAIGREVMLKNTAAQTVVSATANIIPQAGGAATTAILPATAGKWVTLVSDGSAWQIMQSN